MYILRLNRRVTRRVTRLLSRLVRRRLSRPVSVPWSSVSAFGSNGSRVVFSTSFGWILSLSTMVPLPSALAQTLLLGETGRRDARHDLDVTFGTDRWRRQKSSSGRSTGLGRGEQMPQCNASSTTSARGLLSAPPR